ncbi:MAG: serine/threonine-protein kinase, partial [Acidobacteriota bacterium]
MSRRCPECGAEIPAGGPAGLCPQCLLELGLRSRETDADEVAPATPASAVLTLPVGAIVGTPEVMTVGAVPPISGETESLLRGRLLVGSWIILVGLSAFMIRDLLSPVGDLVTPGDWLGRFGVRSLLIVAYAATIWLLRSSRRLDLRRLRALEIAILWAVALWFASDRVYWTRYYLDQRNAADAVFAISFGFLTYFAFLSAYGFFSPNSWRRALWMTGLIALLPIGVLALVAVADPAGMAYLRRVSGLDIEISSMVMMLGIGVMVATWGAHRIHTLRLEAHEAKRLGQYRLTERIGRGGMGEVWKAEHRLLARPAAIKLIKPEMIGAGDPAMAHDFMRSFEREAQITANLRSTHTVELYDFGITADAVFYYVMELLDGRDLESLVRELGPLEPGRVAFLLEQVCDSLAEAHDQGLVHRDIKPGNILVCRLGRRFDFVKVLDFGLVTVRANESEGARPGASRVTVVGTPAYLAPEMASGAAIDARADIYSLGCVAYWLLTGRQVFEGANTAEIVAKHVQEAVTAPGARTGKEIPPVLE